MPLETPQSAPSAESEPLVGKPVGRGLFLTVFLVVTFVASTGMAMWYLVSWDRLAAVMPTKTLLTLLVGLVLRPVAVAAIWFWSRLGLLALVALTIATSYVVYTLGQTQIASAVWSLVLVWLAASRWKDMWWGVSVRPRSRDS